MDRRHPVPNSDHTILVVDDDDSARRLVARLLEEAGYAVLEAPHPHRALELAREHAATIRLLLTDVRMPKMGGVELARRFATLAPAARVLLMSGYFGSGELEHPLLAKPFTPRELLRAVGDLLPVAASR